MLGTRQIIPMIQSSHNGDNLIHQISENEFMSNHVRRWSHPTCVSADEPIVLCRTIVVAYSRHAKLARREKECPNEGWPEKDFSFRPPLLPIAPCVCVAAAISVGFLLALTQGDDSSDVALCMPRRKQTNKIAHTKWSRRWTEKHKYRDVLGSIRSFWLSIWFGKCCAPSLHV